MALEPTGCPLAVEAEAALLGGLQEGFLEGAASRLLERRGSLSARGSHSSSQRQHLQTSRPRDSTGVGEAERGRGKTPTLRSVPTCGRWGFASTIGAQGLMKPAPTLWGAEGCSQQQDLKGCSRTLGGSSL